MKKAVLTLALLSTLTISGFGQIILQSTDLNPQVNNSFVLITCDTTGVNQMVGGPNRVWDFTAGAGLTELSTDTITAISPTGAPHISMFSGTNIVTKSSSKTDTTVNYFIVSATKYSGNGYYSTPNEYATFTDPIDILRFPLHYGDNYSDAFNGYVHYNYLGTPISAGERGTINVTCDGWGKLILPTGTYDSVLRVHGQQVLSDSANIFGLPFFIKVNVNTYAWYIKNYHNALLQISMGDDTSGVFHWKSVVYGKVNIKAGVSDKNKDVSFDVYPNPSNNIINLNLKSITQPVEAIEIMDLNGRLVAQVPYSGQPITTFNAENLAKGSYVIRIKTGQLFTTRKFTKE